MRVTHVLIFGEVQGVGFRSYVRSYGKKLGLVGWVRNLPEGTVEAEFAGPEESVNRLVQLCKRGPFLAQVLSVDVDVVEKDFPYESFELRKDEVL